MDKEIKLESDYYYAVEKVRKSYRKEINKLIFLFISLFVVCLVGGLFIYQDTRNYYDNTQLIDKSYELRESIIDKLKQEVAIVTSIKTIKREYSQPIYIINCQNKNGDTFTITKLENEISINKTLESDEKEYIEYKFLGTEQKLEPLEYKKTFLYDTEKLKKSREKNGLDVIQSGYYEVTLHLHR